MDIDKNMKILLVDDFATMRKVIKKSLKNRPGIIISLRLRMVWKL